jgi:glycosyltransferase involved in cell wall biosynthesis
MPELIEHGRDGFLVSNVGEAVRAIERIGWIDRKNCRATVEKRFTSEIMVNNYIGVYEEILAQL